MSFKMKQPGNPSSRPSALYQALQDQIRDATGIECSVLVTPDRISIRASSYADFTVAKNAIKDRAAGIPIIYDFLPALPSTGRPWRTGQ